MSEDAQQNLNQRLGRMAIYIIIVTASVWVVATWAGNHWGWPMKSRLVFDLMALGGFGFALAVIWRVWRTRQKDEG